MPSVTEQIFRYIFLYSGIYFLCIGASSIFQGGYLFWQILPSHSQRTMTEPLLVFVVYLVVFVAPAVLGLVMVRKFRDFASWGVKQIANYSENVQKNWYDLISFSVILSVVVGIYYLMIGMRLLRVVCPEMILLFFNSGAPLFEHLGSSSNGLLIILLIIRLPFFYLSAGVVFLVFCGKIGKMVEKTVLQTENADYKGSDSDQIEEKPIQIEEVEEKEKSEQ